MRNAIASDRELLRQPHVHYNDDGKVTERESRGLSDLFDVPFNGGTRDRLGHWSPFGGDSL